MLNSFVPSMLRFARCTVVLLSLYGGTAVSGFAWTRVALEPVADTFISQWERTPQGSANPLLTWRDGREALFRFDLSRLPAHSVIQSAIFSVTFAVSPGDGKLPVRYYVYDLAKNFDEVSADWTHWAANQAWSAAGMSPSHDYDVLPYASAAVPIAGPGTYEADITAYIAMLYRSGAVTANLAFLDSDPTATRYAAAIYSRRDPSPAHRPHLILVYSTTAPQARIALQQAPTPAGTITDGDLILSQAQWNHQPIALNGRPSARPDGSRQGLAYQWTLVSPARGSALHARQSLGSAPTLSFNPDVPGSYALSLTVTDSATHEQTAAHLRLTAGIAPQHPRIDADPALIERFKALAAGHDPRWTRFSDAERVNRSNCNLDGCLTFGHLINYVVTGDSRSFTEAWKWVASTIYSNHADNSAGLTTLLQIYKAPHSAGYVGGALIGQVATAYDWLYAGLTPAQRQDIISWLNVAATYDHIQNPTGNEYHRNDGASITYGLAAAAYATLGDNAPANPMAAQLLDWFQDRWVQTLRALDDMGTGLGEGNEYGESPTATHLIHAANIAYYASGENLFLSHRFFKDRLLYNAFAAYPGTVGGKGAPYPYGWPGIFVEYSLGFGDGRWGTGWIQDSVRGDGMLLCRFFPDTPECAAWSYVFRQPELEQSYVYPANSAYLNLLFYAPPPRSATRKSSAPAALSYFDQTSGRVYIRSDWGPDATWISIWAGPHFDTHQHLKAGGYEIFKRRHILPDTGDYDIIFNAAEMPTYYQRTVSSNGLLIADPHEIFQAFNAGAGCDASGKGYLIDAPDNSGPICIPNDGGQRTMAPLGLAAPTPDDYQTFKPVFDTAKIVYFKDDGSAVSVVADITNAYNSPQYTTPGNQPKVKRVWRSWVYLRDADTLLSADVVESTNSDFKKTSLLHALDRIDIAGTPKSISPGEDLFTGVSDARIVVDNNDKGEQDQTTWDLRAGYSSLLIHTVFPRAFRYRRVGGREASATPHGPVYGRVTQKPDPHHLHTHIKDFWVDDFSEGVIPNHKSLNWAPLFPQEENTSAFSPTFVGGFGRYRLEIEPAVPAAVDCFLNVEKPSLNPRETLPPMTPIESATAFGVSFTLKGRHYSIAFPKDTLGPPQIGQ